MSGSDARDDLTRLLLGESPHLTSDEVAEAAGIDVGDVRALWRALGFPDAGGEAAYIGADRDALATVIEAITDDAIDLDTVLKLTRALGITMSRLADWQTSTLTEQIERKVAEGEYDSRIALALRMSRTVGPAFEKLLVYAWRRHLAAAVGRIEALGANDEDLLHQVLTVGFVDLVAFTALSNGIDDAALAELVESFEARCGDIVAAHGARVIKTLGDAVLYVAESADVAVETAFAIIEDIRRDDALPDVRAGLGTGSVINRLGDVYGPPVNLASRLTTVARRNRVIVDEATAALLGPQFEHRKLPARPLRGFGNVEPINVRRRWQYGR